MCRIIYSSNKQNITASISSLIGQVNKYMQTHVFPYKYYFLYRGWLIYEFGSEAMNRNTKRRHTAEINKKMNHVSKKKY